MFQEPKTPLSTPTKVTIGKKDVNQWYDVGIIKGTSSIVSHYHLPSEVSQGNGDVAKVKNWYTRNIGKII